VFGNFSSARARQSAQREFARDKRFRITLASSAFHASQPGQTEKGFSIEPLLGALTSEARASAAVLAALPFVVGALIFFFNHELMATLFADPRGRFMLGVACLSLVAGITVMAVMIKRSVR